MFKKYLITTLLALSSGATLATQTDLQLLQHAEQYRGRAESAVLDCEVELYAGQTLDKTREYQVYLGTDERSLVVFQSKADTGQKVLMNGKDFWMLMPNSRRPIRITPMQKLLGEAALGDIATLSWSKQYKIAGRQTDGSTIVLHLEANSEAASYHKITLRLNSEDHFPQSADLYLRSGMLSKTATFERGARDGKTSVVAMALTDNMKKDSKTVVHYRTLRAMTMPNKLFNPQFLLHANPTELLSD